MALQSPTTGATSSPTPSRSASPTASPQLQHRPARPSRRSARRTRHLDLKHGTVPAIQQFARIRGAIEFACPACTKLLATRRIDPRRILIICNHLPCQRRFLVGLYLAPGVERAPVGFFTLLASAPPTTVCVNTLSAAGLSRHLGRVVGPIEWQCHRGHLTKSVPDWDDATIRCDSCDDTRTAFLVLYPSTRQRPRGTPLDWIPPLDRRVEADGPDQLAHPRV